MKEKSNSETKTGRVRKARGPVQRDVKEVMAELMLRLSQKLEAQPEQASEAESSWYNPSEWSGHGYGTLAASRGIV